VEIKEFLSAIKQLADEKNLSEEIVISAVESALAAAYRKDYGRPGQAIKVNLDTTTNQMKVWRVFVVTEDGEEIVNPEAQLTLEQAKKTKKDAKPGDEILEPLEVKSDFGRVAAQTAKQVIIQKIREAEREMLYEEFKGKENKIANAVVQRIEGPTVIVDLGKINGIMTPIDQIPGERYYTGQRIKVWVSEVEETNRGPRILVSRSSVDFIKGLFAQEVPEIESESIEITNIAREPGSRTKVAVKTNDENLDPVGSVVGQRGTRIQSILTELPNEKIDIILQDDDMEQFITNALSPAKIDKIVFNEKEKSAKIWVSEDQLSLAIGRNGQNVRLASKLSGWILDIVKDIKPEEDEKHKTQVKDAEDRVDIAKQQIEEKSTEKKQKAKKSKKES
jgi:N utilization substance protein A